MPRLLTDLRKILESGIISARWATEALARQPDWDEAQAVLAWVQAGD